ncbi:nuclear pore complex protein Nup133 isoform X2 [Sabethes cyaneus]|uniref:nuclear pore complex protein Nup133 isoform X2 n=1 Tax=Sabethes cyaneus TaxID=53552 RepID=UPI00237DB3C3|nr:nuclear pore complex protein Nup133 isoform X2 [Sabethes cyaneus]
MDKSFGSIYGASKNSNISRSRQSLGGSLFSTGGRSKNSGLLGGPSGRKGSALSTRSNISTLQVVAKSDYNILECYGLPLPVQVNEVLAFRERNAPVSINYSPIGWAWLVHGRRLLIWQYRESQSKALALGSGAMMGDNFPTPRRALTSQCRQLTLPHCDIGHKATLVSVFLSEGHQMASCLAVSPAGDVRYWPSIAHDGSSIDECNILEGQEFEELVSLVSGNYLLVTTTCSLVQLQIQLQGGRQTIVSRQIKPPSGFFGGIGKKFASIIIGMHSVQERENKLIRISSEKVSHHEWHITLLADKWIQRWAFSPGGTNERFLCEDAEIMRKIRDFFMHKFWNGVRGDNSEIELWTLDMQSTDRGVIILAAGCNLQRTPQVHYVLLTFVYTEAEGMVLKENAILKYKGYYSREREEEYLKFKFVANRTMAYVYNDKYIFPVMLDRHPGSSANSESSSPSEELEKIEFNVQDDGILAANCFQNMALFFSKIHGMVIVTPSDFEPNSEVFNSSISSDMFNPNISVNDSVFINQSIFAPATTNAGNLILYDIDPEEVGNANKDNVNQLKAAFIYHIKRNNTASNDIINSILQNVEEKSLDCELDQIVLKIAEDLAEDIPAADPRWEVTSKHGLGSSTSMQIVQQLREKNIALTQFFEFLHASTIWDKLTAVSSGDIVRPTAHLLSDIAEKIVAAIAIKCLHNSHARIIDEAIDITLREGNRTPPSPNLTNQDLFYVQISRMHEIFKVLSELVENYVKQELTTIQVQTALVEVNTITITVLQEVMKFRESKGDLFVVRQEPSRYEYVPWTASSGKYGLRDVLLHMIVCTLKYGIKGSGEPEFRIKHYKQMTELIDFVLDGRKNYLESIQDEGKRAVLQQQYESQRSDLIFPLVDFEQYELAAKLAEKYLDFQILVVICDKTNNQTRLDDYIERYKEYDFSQFAISWHMRQNKQGDIFQRFKGNQAELARFLCDHPSLAWIQLVFNGELAQAAEVLLALAQHEKELLSRKRVMLSLSKLCALAAEGDFSSQIAEINSEARLMDLQEQIPVEVLNIYGYDIRNAKVLTPEEIVDLFIADEYNKSSEAEFRKALELLDFVEEPMEVRHKIWCAAILRDNWEDYNRNAPLDTMQNMMFFRLIDLCYILDGELENFLPPVESFLTATELGELVESKSFQYLIKLGYEHIYDSYKKK